MDVECIDPNSGQTYTTQGTAVIFSPCRIETLQKGSMYLVSPAGHFVKTISQEDLISKRQDGSYEFAKSEEAYVPVSLAITGKECAALACTAHERFA